jgi:dienelactone hydrolase
MPYSSDRNIASKGFREHALRALGGGWPDQADLNTETLQVADKGDYTAELLRYRTEPDEWTQAWLLLPKGDPAGFEAGRPAVALWHQHNDEYHLGKSESAGFAGNPAQHIGPLLAREGYVVLCPDALCFEGRRHPVLGGRDFERHMAMRYLAAGKSLAWKNIKDCRRAVDCLCGRPEVNPNRIGCCGHSLGSTFTWLTGAWDERLVCMVGNCCMPSQASMDANHLNHSYSNYIPGLGLYGDIPEYVALIAPRRLHLNFGAHDRLNPAAFIEKELPSVQAGYREAGAEDAFSWFIDPEAGHELSAAMKERLLQVFRENL